LGPSAWAIRAPWWARWLAYAAMMAAGLVLIGPALFPGYVNAADWPWKLLAVAGFSLMFAAAIQVIQHPAYRTYARALTGLSFPRCRQATKAVRRGTVPPDPAVLAAAVRVGALSRAYLDRVSKTQRGWRWVLPGCYLVIAVLDFVSHDRRKVLLWLGFALYFAAYFVWINFQARRIARHVERLRTAAADIPAAAALAETTGTTSIPPRRVWPIVLVVVVTLIGFGLAEYLWGSREHRTASRATAQDCRTADEALHFLHQHDDMLNSRLITMREPGLNAYQEWSSQFYTYAHSVSNPAIAQHLDRVAELSAQEVAVVQDLRAESIASPSPDVIREHEKAYDTSLLEMFNEVQSATAACDPHSRAGGG